MTERIIARAKAAQLLDRDQPEIITEKFQLPSLARSCEGLDRVHLHAAAADRIGVCPRRVLALVQRKS
jgi:hypothetical protein